MWLVLAGPRSATGERIREHAHHSMAPVWEANHVWLIFVLTVTWTAYPIFFGSIASTLAVPLFIAALGIILRGASYALRSGTERDVSRSPSIRAFAVASLVTPFALGAAAGGIASERVPVGNAAGNLFTSWLNPTSILIGRWRWPARPTWRPCTWPPTPSGPATPSSCGGRSGPARSAAGVVAGAIALGRPGRAALRRALAVRAS